MFFNKKERTIIDVKKLPVELRFVLYAASKTVVHTIVFSDIDDEMKEYVKPYIKE